MRTCPVCQRNYADEMDFCPRDGSVLAAPVAETQFDLNIGLTRRYRIIRRLGEGGMGTVFLAEQIAVGNRPVALKVLRRTLTDDPEFLQRFQDEAASTGRIRHPNVVTVFECGQTDDGSPYIAMEYLEGETLRQALARRGSLPLDSVAEILQQAGRGLNAAHKLGIVHRDLKPDNVFLTHDDEGKALVKIVDFGIAKMREASTRTMTGLAIGTPRYMSVEQASGMRSETLDGRSDVYSLGIVAYEAITGRLPFDADTPMGFVAKHLVESPQPIRVARPDLGISERVGAVVMKALAKNRDDRFASTVEFAREFAAAASAPAELGAARMAAAAGASAVSVTATAAPANTPVQPEPVTSPVSDEEPVYRLMIEQSRLLWSPVKIVWASLCLIAAVTIGWFLFAPAKAPAPASAPPVSQAPSASANLPIKPEQALTPEQSQKVKAALALGDLLYGRGEYDDALSEYRQGLDAAPGNPTLRARVDRTEKAKAADQKVRR